MPPIAVISRSCRLDWDSSFFRQAEQRPVVVTVASATAADRARAAEAADVVVAGDTDVDLSAAVAVLGERGYDNVLAEGGPGVAAQLAAAGLLDEVCLTVSPLLVAGAARRSSTVPAWRRRRRSNWATCWKPTATCSSATAGDARHPTAWRERPSGSTAGGRAPRPAGGGGPRPGAGSADGVTTPDAAPTLGARALQVGIVPTDLGDPGRSPATSSGSTTPARWRWGRAGRSTTSVGGAILKLIESAGVAHRRHRRSSSMTWPGSGG